MTSEQLLDFIERTQGTGLHCTGVHHQASTRHAGAALAGGGLLLSVPGVRVGDMPAVFGRISVGAVRTQAVA